MRKRLPISEQLRAAILAAPDNRRQIAMATGVAESVLSRFVRGEQGITLQTADVLAAYLRLELRPARRQRKER